MNNLHAFAIGEREKRERERERQRDRERERQRQTERERERMFNLKCNVNSYMFKSIDLFYALASMTLIEVHTQLLFWFKPRFQFYSLGMEHDGIR
jgi:hypothetical protein